jgi:hypothetical protein
MSPAVRLTGTGISVTASFAEWIDESEVPCMSIRVDISSTLIVEKPTA